MVIIINITEIILSRLIIMVHSDATTKIIIFEYARLGIIIIIRLEFHIITDKNNNDRAEKNSNEIYYREFNISSFRPEISSQCVYHFFFLLS